MGTQTNYPHVLKPNKKVKLKPQFQNYLISVFILLAMQSATKDQALQVFSTNMGLAIGSECIMNIFPQPLGKG